MSSTLDHSECFACSRRPLDPGQEAPGSWLKPRYACWRHTELALLPNGQPLSALLDHPLPEGNPLEGSGLNFLLNPVTIDGLKGWADFAAGGYAVTEELFPSEDLSDYLAQHVAWGVDVLYALYRRRDSYGFSSTLNFLVESLGGGDRLENFGRLGRFRDRWLSVRQELARRRKIGVETPQEAFQVLDTTLGSAGEAASHDMAAHLDRLLQLADTRFAHL